MIVASHEPAVGFMASTTDDGFTWTLTSRLGWLLCQAEELYGLRDRTYTVLGIEFGNDGPMVWYPSGARSVIIQLSHSAAQSPEQALFQLAHEVVHLLAPSGGRHALVFEEGLATYFADEMSNSVGSVWRSHGVHYLAAKALVAKLLAKDALIVKKIRQTEPDFCKWTPGLIRSVAPSVLSESELLEVCRPFS